MSFSFVGELAECLCNDQTQGPVHSILDKPEESGIAYCWSGAKMLQQAIMWRLLLLLLLQLLQFSLLCWEVSVPLRHCPCC
jgi:hypothetical protein